MEQFKFPADFVLPFSQFQAKLDRIGKVSSKFQLYQSFLVSKQIESFRKNSNC